MRRVFQYLNPIAHLGNRDYSVLFPFFTGLLAALLGELLQKFVIFHDSFQGLYAILVFIALIIYFSFRKGIRGGLMMVAITISYYLYIIFFTQSPEQRRSGLETTAVLTVLYVLLAFIIGWLKQTIDHLIERESDEKIRLLTIIEQLPVGVVITDSKGMVVQSNKRVDKILDIKVRLGSWVGHDTLVSGITEDGVEVDASHSPLAYVLTKGKALVGKEFVLKKSSGKQTHLLVNTSPIRNRQGKIIAAAAIINDITQQREMEKRKDDFVNMASHELKTPLTSMKIYTDLLAAHAKESTDVKSMKLVKTIHEQTDRLQELVEDLLDVSRLQTGKLSFNKEEFRLDELIKQIVEELKIPDGQNILFKKPTIIKVTADKFRIYQVIANFILNAQKYSPRRSTIVITANRKNGDAYVTVQDKGIGIAQDQQGKIFEKLYQVTDDHAKTFPGFGMGLYIAKEIIERHKGKIGVMSEKGKGSTFYFTLPL